MAASTVGIFARHRPKSAAAAMRSYAVRPDHLRASSPGVRARHRTILAFLSMELLISRRRLGSAALVSARHRPKAALLDVLCQLES